MLKKNTKSNYWSFFILLFFTLTVIITWIYIDIKETIKETSLQEDPMLYKLKQILLPLHPDVKHIKIYKGDKSYTINKEKIYLCLKDENGEYYPTNQLIYVMIHEIAHLINKDDIGHSEKFHTIFEDLLKKAQELKIYDPYIIPIQNYCNYNK